MSDINLASTDSESKIPAEREPAIKWGWVRALSLLVVWFIVYAVVTSLMAVVMITLSGQDPMKMMSDQANLIETIGVGPATLIHLIGFGSTLLVIWIFRRFIDRRSLLSIGFKFKTYRNDFIAGLGWGFALILIGFIVLWISGMLTITEIRFDPVNLFFYLIMFTIVAFNEEIVVRGYVLLNLMGSVNKYIALLISSILFSAMHLANANISVTAAINIFLAGLILGIYFIHKRNLWFSIGMHLTWNFFEGPIFGFEVSGNKTSSIIVQNINGPDLLTGGEFGFEGSLIATVAIILITIVIHLKHRQSVQNI